jgi:hypothetical protein
MMEGRESNVNAAIKQFVNRKYIVSHQSCNSISRRMRSRTSRSPPPSFLTRRGLRVSTLSALSCLLRLEPGLVGASLSLDVCAEAGISSHSCPSMSSGLRKNGHKEFKIVRDSWASAVDIGTGDDFKTAEATSEAGRARRLRVESPTFVVDGPEKSLAAQSATETIGKVEAYIQTLSATPSNRPSSTRRRISSWLNFSS